MRLFLFLSVLFFGMISVSQGYTNPAFQMQMQQMQMQQMMNGYHQTKVKYDFEGWPKGSTTPINFKSAIYKKDGVSFVHLDGNNFLFHEDSLMRTPSDFDSLFAKADSGKMARALIVDSVWVFERYAGAAAIYASEPKEGTWTYMDTGAGLVKYSKKALRKKLYENPRSATMLRTENICYGLNWGMVIGGLALAGIGVALSEETKDADGEPNGGIKFSPLAPIGLGIAVASWIPYLIAQPQYEGAIKAYNQDVPKK